MRELEMKNVIILTALILGVIQPSYSENRSKKSQYMYQKGLAPRI